MRHALTSAAAGFGLLVASAISASAVSLPTLGDGGGDGFSAGDVIPIAQGCGPGGWRGPWGGCRHTPYWGPMPGGGWAVPPPYAFRYYGNGCPPGYWRGPWGHCRDTPYHGRLPGGGWK